MVNGFLHLIRFDANFFRVLILVPFLLASCGKDCISPEGGLNDRYQFSICANPTDDKELNCQRPENFQHSDAKTQWVKTNIVVGDAGAFNQGRIAKLAIHPSDNLDVCSGGCPDLCIDKDGKNICNTDFCKITEVNAGPKYTPELDMQFKSGDKIGLSLFPFLHPQPITEEICDGYDSRIYAGDPNTCKQKYLGKYYHSVVGDTDDASANILKSDYTPWISGTALYSTESAAVIKRYQDAGKGICDLLKKNPDSTEAKDIKKKVDLITINTFCQNIKKRQYDQNLNSNEICGQTSYAPFAVFDQEEYFNVVLGLDLALKNSASNSEYNIRDNKDAWVNNAACYMPGVKLNTPILIDTKNKSYNKVIFNLYQTWNQPSHSGGYKFVVSRRCQKRAGEILYMYIGQDEPNFKPGESESILVGPIDMPDGSDFTREIDIKLQEGKYGNIFFGIKDIEENSYKGHQGHFKVNASVKIAPPTLFSWMIKNVRNQILRILYGNNQITDGGQFNNQFLDAPGDGAVGSIYKAIVNSTLLNTLKAMMALSVIICSILFLIGSLRTPQVDFIVILVKIGIVATLFSDNSWGFFNENLFNLFISGSTELINVMSGPFHDANSKATDFAFVDMLLGKFGQGHTWLQMLSLLFAGPAGWLFLAAIFWGLLETFKAILNASVYYFISVVLVAILICIAPIFISFILFKRTKTIFDSWIKNLAQIAVLPSIIFASVAFIANCMSAIVHSIFDFEICTGCVIEPAIDIKLTTWKFCLLRVYLPSGYDISSSYVNYGFSNIPISIAALIAFVVFGHAISAFVSHASVIAMSIFGAPGANVSDPAEKFKDSMQSIIGSDKNSKQMAASQDYRKNLDQAKELPKPKPEK